MTKEELLKILDDGIEVAKNAKLDPLTKIEMAIAQNTKEETKDKEEQFEREEKER